MSSTHSADGTSIAYEVIGDGPAVILVDGAMCFRDSGPMRPIAEALAGQLRVVLYDRRGRGESGDTLPFSIVREIEDIDALIDVAGGSAALFGTSSGGALAVAAAAALGSDRVPALTVYEPPFLPDELIDAAFRYTEALGTALATDDRDAAVALFLAHAGMPGSGIDGLRGSPAWDGMKAMAPTLAYDDAIMGDSAVPDEVAGALRVPVLALAGGASPEFLRYGARSLAESVADGRFEVLEEQGHDIRPDALAPHLLAFLGE